MSPASDLRIEQSATPVAALAAVGTIPGVTVKHAAAANGPGTAMIGSVGDGDRLRFKAPSSASWGPTVDVSGGDGDYVLVDGSDPSRWIEITVTVSALNPGAVSGSVFLADLYNNAVASDDVTASEAAAGSVETTTVDLANRGQSLLTNLSVWLDAAVSDLEISDDGVSWYSPTTESTALPLGQVAPGDAVTLHLRRSIAAASGSNPKVLNHLHAVFDGI